MSLVPAATRPARRCGEGWSNFEPSRLGHAPTACTPTDGPRARQPRGPVTPPAFILNGQAPAHAIVSISGPSAGDILGTEWVDPEPDRAQDGSAWRLDVERRDLLHANLETAVETASGDELSSPITLADRPFRAVPLPAADLTPAVDADSVAALNDHQVAELPAVADLYRGEGAEIENGFRTTLACGSRSGPPGTIRTSN